MGGEAGYLYVGLSQMSQVFNTPHFEQTGNEIDTITRALESGVILIGPSLFTRVLHFLKVVLITQIIYADPHLTFTFTYVYDNVLLYTKSSEDSEDFEEHKGPTRMQQIHCFFFTRHLKYSFSRNLYAPIHKRSHQGT